MISRKIFSIRYISCLALVVLYSSCSSSDSGTSTQASQSVAKPSGEAAAEKVEDTSSLSNSGAAAANSSGVSAAATAAASSSDPVGCSLPPKVAKLMGAGGGASASLTSWGDGKMPDYFKNLDLNNCSWYKEAKRSGNYSYMIVFETEAQTYTQLYPGGVNAVVYAACLASAAAATPVAGGKVSCGFLP